MNSKKRNNNKEENLKLDVELKQCSRCNNPFFVNKNFIVEEGEKLKELVCDNCIKLEKRKRELEIGVFENLIEVKDKMDSSINDMLNSLRISRGQFNKQFFLKEIKKRVNLFKKSVELIEKIEDSNDEKFVDEFAELFEKMKRESSK